MPDPTFHRSYRSVSDSLLVDTMAESLSVIKEADKLTDADIGRELGKAGEDSGRAYRTGFATMNAVSFLRGCERWNGRFANDSLALVGMKLVPLDSGAEIGQSSATALTKLLWQISVALEDGQVDDDELAAMKAAIDGAGDAIDGMRTRLSVRSA